MIVRPQRRGFNPPFAASRHLFIHLGDLRSCVSWQIDTFGWSQPTIRGPCRPFASCSSCRFQSVACRLERQKLIAGAKGVRGSAYPVPACWFGQRAPKIRLSVKRETWIPGRPVCADVKDKLRLILS